MNTNADEIYVSLLKKIKNFGYSCEPARDKMPSTKAIFGEKLEFDNQVFPILQGKKVSFKNILTELLWFLRGDTNIKFLLENNCHIWDDDAYRYYLNRFGGKLNKEEFLDLALKGEQPFMDGVDKEIYKNYSEYVYGDLGRVYGYQWRNFGMDNLQYYSFIQNPKDRYKEEVFKYRKSIDQIGRLIFELKENPFSRYHIVDAWNIQDYVEGFQALPACHCNFMCNVFKHSDGELYLDLAYRQRSCDVPLGVPYNISSYALLQRILCELVGYKVGRLIAYLDNVHYYENQIDYVNEYISRFDKEEIPNNNIQIEIDSSKWKGNIDNIKLKDFKIINYNPLSSIKAPLSVGL